MIETITIVQKGPRLTLVGAGPGDPELITLKGIKAIQNADVVLYDALVSEDIVKLIPSHIPSMAVGKRAGEHSYRQEEINELIVEMAYVHGHVVRLKGGDSFVFGRGSEEIEFAEKHGVKTSVVPGLSSATAVPASLNIPLTSRGISESFWVVTGTTKEGVISGDVALAAQSTATVVILMGLNKITEIMSHFSKTGKNDLPVAVIQNGTLSAQKSVMGSVSTIAELTISEGIASPAIIIVGEVVRHAKVLEKVLVSVNTNYEQ